MQFDATGKVTFDHIYTQPDPRAYFATLRQFDYRIPQEAKPHFLAQLQACDADVPQVLDIGCSYGINAALLRCDVTIANLYDRYADAADNTRAELLSYDRELARGRGGVVSSDLRAVASGVVSSDLQAVASGAGVRARYVGLDVSVPALEYAHAAGFLDDAVHADLEAGDPTPAQRAQLAGTDLVISTGCLGYVGAPTLRRVVESCERPPAMAHFVLRMFSYEEIAENLAELGYETTRHAGVFPQRRFASATERDQVLDTLATVGVDPAGFESDGWFYAELFVSRPRQRVQRPRQKEKTMTYGNEDRLPRVPLPTLEDSCARFLEWCAPLLTSEELASTEAAVADFLRPDSQARDLHAELVRFDEAEGTESWLDKFWPSRYLGRRDRIALNANFFFLFGDTGQRQVERAAGLLAGAVDYKLRLDEELVPPALQRGEPLSMRQHRFLFGTTRIPGVVQDMARFGSAARHVVVFFRG